MIRENRWHPGRAIRAWLTSRLFARQLADFLLILIVLFFGGSISATLVTFFLLPTAYAVLERRKERKAVRTDAAVAAVVP